MCIFKHFTTMISATLLVIYLVSLLVVVTAVFLNVTGAVLLWKFERGNTNQRTILLNLSICQGIISSFVAVVFCLRIVGLTYENKYVQIFDSVAFLCFIEYYFIMMIMTIDRFIGSKYPLRCSDIFSKPRLKTLLLLTWSLCLTMGILSSIFYKVVTNVFENIVFPILDVMTLCCIATVYGYIMYVVSARKLATSATARRRNTESRQLIKMTAIITSTFIAFIVIPDFVLAFTRQDISKEIEGVIFFWFYSGLAADPITYLLIRKRLRKSFFNICKCCCRRHKAEHRQSTTTNRSQKPAVIVTKL